MGGQELSMRGCTSLACMVARLHSADSLAALPPSDAKLSRSHCTNLLHRSSSLVGEWRSTEKGSCGALPPSGHGAVQPFEVRPERNACGMLLRRTRRSGASLLVRMPVRTQTTCFGFDQRYG